jgi:hypothetical protein
MLIDHCCRLRATATIVAVEIEGGYAMLVEGAFEFGAAIHRFGCVISHTFTVALPLVRVLGIGCATLERSSVQLCSESIRIHEYPHAVRRTKQISWVRGFFLHRRRQALLAAHCHTPPLVCFSEAIAIRPSQGAPVQGCAIVSTRPARRRLTCFVRLLSMNGPQTIWRPLERGLGLAGNQYRLAGFVRWRLLVPRWLGCLIWVRRGTGESSAGHHV